jgi:membrane associated rhomboid family serine protease
LQFVHALERRDPHASQTGLGGGASRAHVPDAEADTPGRAGHAMLIPLHDDNPRRRTPVATIAIIAAVLLAWFVAQGAGQGFDYARSICDFGMIPGELTGRAIGAIVPLGDGLVCVVDPAPAWHTVLTSMFLHGDWFHLIGNLWFLWLFGDNIEDHLGTLGFVVLYVICGLAAAMVQLVIDPASPIPMVGASGAISGVMGAYIVLFPRVPVRVLAILIVIPLVFRLPAILILGYWFLLQILGALPQLGGGAEAGVAFWAHIGGFVAGALIALARRPRPAHDAAW